VTALEITTIGVVCTMFVVTMSLWGEMLKSRQRVTVLRSDMRELKHRVEEIVQHLQGPMPVVPPPEPPKSRRPSTKQVTTAVSDLRKWSEELGEDP
jgi:hypothetical protein